MVLYSPVNLVVTEGGLTTNIMVTGEAFLLTLITGTLDYFLQKTKENF